jgi:hypothetical protein
MTIQLVRDEMLHDRYIIFREDMSGIARNIFLIDTEQHDKNYGGLYLWGIEDNAVVSTYDLYEGRMIINRDADDI